VDKADDLADFEVPAYARNNPQVSPVPPSMPAEELMAMLAGPPDPESEHDPVADYRAITCPVFLQYGEHDTSVPVPESVERIAAVCPTLTVRRYPDLDHTLNLVPTNVVGLSTEEAMYLHHGFRFGSGVWADLTSWLRSVTRP
jgi:pimeloyl-ACP methyl ester carboxylesterase